MKIEINKILRRIKDGGRLLTTKGMVAAAFLAAAGWMLAGDAAAHRYASRLFEDLPRMWEDREIAELEIPLAEASRSPKHVSSEFYYSIPVRLVYKNYPAYAPGKEPAGYQEWLKQQEPEVIPFDVSALKTEADWIKAGEAVFETPIFYNAVVKAEHLSDPAWPGWAGAKAANDGVYPFFRYVVREKGKVELGTISCAMCHTRVMEDGTVIRGAQGNFPFERAGGFKAEKTFTPEFIRFFTKSFFDAPWVKPNPLAELGQLPLSEVIDRHVAMPAGVIARQGASQFAPTQVPDLIGVKDRRYLDHTGIMQHRGVVDLMRYSAINQGADMLASYGGFVPGARDFRTRPEAAKLGRYSDEQLYALSLYLYSLKPPTNPNKFDALAEEGQKVFSREGCAKCHTPPLYTSNQLTPVDGFTPPSEHLRKFDVMPTSVGTDPTLALETRRGTGYYKIPSLLGVWYRGPFEHNGSVATLEDWFDPRRIRNDYVPTGFLGAGVKTRAVKGHVYGLDLSAQDRKALIAFLKTL